MTTRTLWRGLGCAAVAAATIGAGRASADLIDRILAIVDGRLVTLSDAYVALAVGMARADGAADPVEAAMSTLIERHLVMAEVDRYGLPEPDEATVDRRAEQLRAALATRVSGGLTPDQLGLSDQRLHDIALEDVRIEAYLAQRFGVVQPTDAEVLQYYRDHPQSFSRGGAILPFAEVQDTARQHLAAERRQQLIDAWIADLRRRADVNVLYRPREPGFVNHPGQVSLRRPSSGSAGPRPG